MPSSPSRVRPPLLLTPHAAIDFVPKVSSVYENVKTTFLEPEQFDRMRKLLDPLRDDLAVFAVLTGLRHKQSVHLRIDQVSPDCSRLYFDRRDTKNGMPLEIELSDDARDIIKELRKRSPVGFSQGGENLGLKSTRHTLNRCENPKKPYLCRIS